METVVAAEASVIFEVSRCMCYWHQTVEAALRDYPIVRLEGAGDAVLVVIRVAHWLQMEQKANKTGVRLGIRQVGMVDFPKIEIWIERGPGERILVPYSSPIDQVIFVDLVDDHYPRARQLLRAQKRIMLLSSWFGILRLITMFLALQNEDIGRRVYIYTWSYEPETGALMQIVMEGIARRRDVGSPASPLPSSQSQPEPL